FSYSMKKKENLTEKRGVFGHFSLFAISWRMAIAPIRNRVSILSDVISRNRHGLLMSHQMSGACRASTPTQQWFAYGNDECDVRNARTGVDA
ncbi:MAG: hypothetical protein ACREXO_02695, partial [Advenella sp.]